MLRRKGGRDLILGEARCDAMPPGGVERPRQVREHATVREREVRVGCHQCPQLFHLDPGSGLIKFPKIDKVQGHLAHKKQPLSRTLQ